MCSRVTNGLYANISVNEYVLIPTLEETAAQVAQTLPQPGHLLHTVCLR